MSNIEWLKMADGTQGKSWNPVTGCTKVSAGCKNCYAERIAKRFWGDRKFTDVQFHEDRLDQPLKRKKPTRYFVNSMSDLFHNVVHFDFIDRVFEAMCSCGRHEFMILTKRPERMATYITIRGYARDHIWLGVSVESPDFYNRIYDLQITPAIKRFLSLEPALAAMPDLPLDGIDLIIMGGESGPGYRPMELQWARNVRDQCKAAGVPFFFKQVAGKGPIPDDLMIREWPS